MNLYEHTIITRPDMSPTQIKQLEEKYIKLVEKFEGNIEKIDKNLLRYLTVKVKKFDLNTSYFVKKEEEKEKKH